jgi:methionyl-tRNA formyltransferase
MDVIFLGVNDVGFRIYDWLCRRDGVDVISMITEPEQLELVSRESPEVIVSVGFDHLVPQEILQTASRGAINLHASYLPFNRGKSPNVWPLVEDTPAGVTLHYMDDEFDTGDVIAQTKVKTDFADTGKDLHRRLEEVQFDLFTDTWPEIESDNVEREAQEADSGTYHSTADFRELCEIDPDETVRVKDFLDVLRALTFPPFDNAHVEIEGNKYYVDVDIRKAVEEAEEQTDGLISSY